MPALPVSVFHLSLPCTIIPAASAVHHYSGGLCRGASDRTVFAHKVVPDPEPRKHGRLRALDAAARPVAGPLGAAEPLVDIAVVVVRVFVYSGAPMCPDLFWLYLSGSARWAQWSSNGARGAYTSSNALLADGWYARPRPRIHRLPAINAGESNGHRIPDWTPLTICGRQSTTRPEIRWYEPLQTDSSTVSNTYQDSR